MVQRGEDGCGDGGEQDTRRTTSDGGALTGAGAGSEFEFVEDSLRTGYTSGQAVERVDFKNYGRKGM